VTVRILKGDCRDVLRSLPDESVHCVVTSPPYWGLRDYGVAGQLGMERTLGEHVETMAAVFRDVRRVLRKDGTLWLNYGDSYATSVNGRSAADTKAAGNDDRTFRDKPFSTIGPVWRAGNPDKNGGRSNRNGLSVDADCLLKPKDLCGIPWRVAFALQADGWYLRQDIIWSKPNPMPESVTDRCTKAHEYIFLLSKSGRYHFDSGAISETATFKRNVPRRFGAAEQTGTGRQDVGRTFEYPETRNKRSVWEVATQPFPGTHFATFPPELIEPCILAGCPKGGTVLDPFGGAGTTGMVADRLGRDAVLIELNPEYAAMAQNRIKGDAGMFAEVMDERI
jgi:DNA modification methylase